MKVPHRHESDDEKESKVEACSSREPPAVFPFLKRKKGERLDLETQTHSTLSKPNTGARRTLFKKEKGNQSSFIKFNQQNFYACVKQEPFPPLWLRLSLWNHLLGRFSYSQHHHAGSLQLFLPDRQAF